MEREKNEGQDNQDQFEAACAPLIPVMRDLMKAEAEDRAVSRALSLALKASTGTPEEIQAVIMLVDRHRWCAGVLGAKRKAWEMAARERGFRHSGFAQPTQSLFGAARYLRDLLTNSAE